MPVKIIVKQLLDARGMNISQFADVTKVSYPTALAWYHGTVRRIELETLGVICDGLGVGLMDILEYTPEENTPTPR